MYQSRKRISGKGMQQLKSNLSTFVNRKDRVYCKALKRPVSLDKLPTVITERHDAKRRLQVFDVALDILRNETQCAECVLNGYTCYEIRGKAADGNVVIIHLREEVIHKDRVLFFVSCAPG